MTDTGVLDLDQLAAQMTEADWFEMVKLMDPGVTYEDMRLSWLEFKEYTRKKPH